MLRADPQRVWLEYDWSTEICIWVAAGSSVLAGFFGAARVGMQERERRRRRVVDDWVCYSDSFGLWEQGVDLLQHKITVSTMSRILSFTATFFASIAFVVGLVCTVYVRQHRDALQRDTCHMELGQQHDAVFKCTRELALCDISPYLLKSDVSESAKNRRQNACGQLVSTRSYNGHDDG
jgi:hypothetical protein